MKIKLEHPYNKDWKLGYLRESKDKRKRVDLFNSNTDRTTVSYARYIKSVEIGAYIPDGFEVDHINNDCTDDRLENLQIITREDHLRKTASVMSTGRSGETRNCPYCGTSIFVEYCKIRNKNNVFCSRSCNAKYSREVLKINNLRCDKKIQVSEELIEFIRTSRDAGKSDYWIENNFILKRGKIKRLREEYNIP